MKVQTLTGFVLLMSLVLISPNPAQRAQMKIAFASDRDGNFEIYVMNADGTNHVNLTNHPALDDHPAWSPDGTRIAFASWRDPGGGEIYVMNADGKNPVNLTNNLAKDQWPSWSVMFLTVSPKGKSPIQWGEIKHIK